MRKGHCEEPVLLLWRAAGTDLLQSEDHGDVLLGAHGDQVVGQQLVGRQELVFAALIDEDVQLGPGVRRGQRCGVVRLQGAETQRQICPPWSSTLTEALNKDGRRVFTCSQCSHLNVPLEPEAPCSHRPTS